MKSLFAKPLHLAILIILITVGFLYWYASEQQQRLDAPATGYLHQALTDIGSWDAQALRRQLAAEANAATTAAQLEALATRYRPLGAFRGLDDLTFGRLAAALSIFDTDPLLSYSANARFANGSAHLTATLVLRNQHFQLYNFNLSSPQLDATHP